ERAHGRGDPLVEVGSGSLVPPWRPPLTERGLRVAHAPPSVALPRLHGAPSGHELLDQLLTEGLGYRGVRRPPPSPVEDCLMAVVWSGRIHVATLRLVGGEREGLGPGALSPPTRAEAGGAPDEYGARPDGMYD